jgi:hypothetical protein
MVVDCSVTMPWLLKNDKTGYAVKVLQSLGTTIALVPRLWFCEIPTGVKLFSRYVFVCTRCYFMGAAHDCRSISR